MPLEESTVVHLKYNSSSFFITTKNYKIWWQLLKEIKLLRKNLNLIIKASIKPSPRIIIGPRNPSGCFESTSTEPRRSLIFNLDITVPQSTSWWRRWHYFLSKKNLLSCSVSCTLIWSWSSGKKKRKNEEKWRWYDNLGQFMFLVKWKFLCSFFMLAMN